MAIITVFLDCSARGTNTQHRISPPSAVVVANVGANVGAVVSSSTESSLVPLSLQFRLPFLSLRWPSCPVLSLELSLVLWCALVKQEKRALANGSQLSRPLFAAPYLACSVLLVIHQNQPLGAQTAQTTSRETNVSPLFGLQRHASWPAIFPRHAYTSNS